MGATARSAPSGSFPTVALTWTISSICRMRTPLSSARVSVKFSRGIKRQPITLLKKLRKSKKACAYGEKPVPVKTHMRNMVIVPEMIGSVVVYNGKTFINVEVRPEMIGHYLAEFSISYSPVQHGQGGKKGKSEMKFAPLK